MPNVFDCVNWEFWTNLSKNPNLHVQKTFDMHINCSCKRGFKAFKFEHAGIAKGSFFFWGGDTVFVHIVPVNFIVFSLTPNVSNFRYCIMAKPLINRTS